MALEGQAFAHQGHEAVVDDDRPASGGFGDRREGPQVVLEAREAITDGKPRTLDFGVTNEQAWEVGLACGGKVQVYVERID